MATSPWKEVTPEQLKAGWEQREGLPLTGITIVHRHYQVIRKLAPVDIGFALG